MSLYYLIVECPNATFAEVEKKINKSGHFYFRDKATPGLHYLILARRSQVQRILLLAATFAFKCLELDEKTMRVLHRNARIVHQEGNPMLLSKK